MTVEMTVMLPVVIVVVFIVFSLMLYLNSCTQFDSAATQAVLVMSAQSNKRMNLGRDEACIKTKGQGHLQKLSALNTSKTVVTYNLRYT